MRQPVASPVADRVVAYDRISSSDLWQKFICDYFQKNANILKNRLKWFVVFMKFVVFIKHCDSIWLK
jgi:hypothetical protein